MSDMKPRGTPITLGREERHFLFTLNLIDQLEDKYGKTMQSIIEDMTAENADRHMLRDVVTMLLNNEAARSRRQDDTSQELREVTEEEVGDMIDLDNYYIVLRAILQAYGISLPEPEDADPNTQSGQTNS